MEHKRRTLYAASLTPHCYGCHGYGPTPLPTVVEVTAQHGDPSVCELFAASPWHLGALSHGDGAAHTELTISQGSHIYLRHLLSPELRVA